jgi:hypothetical protein
VLPAQAATVSIKDNGAHRRRIRRFLEPENRMKHVVLGLVMLAATVVVRNSPGASAGNQDDAWRSAAKSVLSRYAWQRDLVIVIGSGVSGEAAKAIATLGKTMAESALPDQAHFSLPPGNFLLVREFKRVGSNFEMGLTTGPIPINATTNCGTTTTYTIVRNAAGKWQPLELVSVAMC